MKKGEKTNEASVLFDKMRVRFPVCILNSRGICGYVSALLYLYLSLCLYLLLCERRTLLSLFTAPAELTLYIIYCDSAGSPRLFVVGSC